jgi:hypothetical protein
MLLATTVFSRVAGTDLCTSFKAPPFKGVLTSSGYSGDEVGLLYVFLILRIVRWQVQTFLEVFHKKSMVTPKNKV